VVQLYQLQEEDLKLDVEGQEVQDISVPPEIQQLLSNYGSIFASKVTYPPVRSCSHSIPLVPGAKPFYIRPYRYPPLLKDEIERQVNEMLDADLIQHSNNPFSSPVLLVKKKDNSFRFCIDYRHLNAITLKGQFHIPIIDEFMDELQNAMWFSTLDLCAGFHQIQMNPACYFKTAFQTHVDHYEFRVMSFGLTGAPHSFQKAMNSTLSPFLSKFMLVFFDDILIYSKSYEEHLVHLEQVFMLLQQESWSVKLSKYSFYKQKIAYLGYAISDKGVSTGPKKVQAVADWPKPQNVRKLRGFLGLAGYYKKFGKKKLEVWLDLLLNC
jgi:hypothetical protein